MSEDHDTASEGEKMGCKGLLLAGGCCITHTHSLTSSRRFLTSSPPFAPSFQTHNFPFPSLSCAFLFPRLLLSCCGYRLSIICNPRSPCCLTHTLSFDGQTDERKIERETLSLSIVFASSLPSSDWLSSRSCVSRLESLSGDVC